MGTSTGAYEINEEKFIYIYTMGGLHCHEHCF